jgi:microcystin-dependent protein
MTMPYQFNVYVLILFVSAPLAAVVCAYAWRYRAAPGAVSLVVVLLTLTIWEIASALELAAIDAPTAIFWFKSQGALQLIAATAAFCFALEYAGLGQWLKRSILILLAIPIMAWVLLILTNDAHHQVWPHIWFDGYVRASRGILLYVFLGYGLLLSFFTLLTWLMLWMRWRLHRWLAGSVFVIILIARIAFFLDFGDLNPFAPLDPTILATNLTCLVYFIVLYRFQFFDVTPIAQNTALFSLLGTTYGGDGKTTFGLPDLQGRAPMHWGQGAGLSNYPSPGIKGGAQSVNLDATTTPSHTHAASGDANSGGQQSPTNNVWGTQAGRSPANLYASAAPNVNMSGQILDPVGSGQPHNNMQPYLALMFIIALQGIYPSRG